MLDAKRYLDTEETARLLLGCIEHFRAEHGADLPLARFSVLLAVALNPRVQQLDLGRMVNMTDSSVSRHVMDMTYLTRSQAPGPELLAQIPDPIFRRRNLVEVTQKGRKLLDEFCAIANKAISKGR